MPCPLSREVGRISKYSAKCFHLVIIFTGHSRDGNDLLNAQSYILGIMTFKLASKSGLCQPRCWGGLCKGRDDAPSLQQASQGRGSNPMHAGSRAKGRGAECRRKRPGASKLWAGGPLQARTAWRGARAHPPAEMFIKITLGKTYFLPGTALRS